MDATTQNKNERINLRLKSSAKSLIERAASFEGKTVGHFILTRSKFKLLGKKRQQITSSVKPHRPFAPNDLEITALCKFCFVGLRNINFT